MIKTLAVCLALASAASAQTSQPDRVPVKNVIPDGSINVPRVLLVQLKKDLGDTEFLPRTVDALAEQLQVERLALIDPRSTSSTRTLPPDTEFYWLSGPVALCGSGGCAGQLYWASPSTATTGRLFPTTDLEDERAFNHSPTVMSRSTNGLFNLDLFEASDSHPGSRPSTRPPDTTLTFDGQRYGIQSKKKP